LNRTAATAVEAWLSRALRAAATIGLLASLSCVEIEGGAIELAWALRDFAGDENSCQKAGVGEIRVCWRAVDDAGSTDCVTVREDGGVRGQYRDFACTANRGITRFEVPPGPTSIFVKPLCAVDGLASPGPYQVPPPIVRTVEQGRVVTLDQLLVVATRTGECGGDTGLDCTCPPAQ
jgi:hypothetical protein